jgi:hypothetical protein
VITNAECVKSYLVFYIGLDIVIDNGILCLPSEVRRLVSFPEKRREKLLSSLSFIHGLLKSLAIRKHAK